MTSLDSTPRRVLGRARARRAEASPSYRVLLRYRDNEGHSEVPQVGTVELTLDDVSFYPYVQHWRYVVANRQRITQASRESLDDSTRQWIRKAASLTDNAISAHLRGIARSEVVEVVIPYAEEATGWAARLFPWENALALVTRPLRSTAARFTVIRHLQRTGPPQERLQLSSFMVVRSAPGDVSRLFDLDRQCRVVLDALAVESERGTAPGEPGRDPNFVEDPDRGLLEDVVRAKSPTLIHIAALDPHVLAQRGLPTAPPDEAGEGVVLRGSQSEFDVVSSIELAKVVTVGRPRPLLVTLSSSYGALRATALAVAEGAQHAIGFLDTITDADATFFFSAFYRAFAEHHDVLTAFSEARIAYTTQTATPSTGVVLWSAVSLLDTASVPMPAVQVVPVSSGRRRVATPSAARPQAAPRTVTVADLSVDIQLLRDRGPIGQQGPTTSLNYSLLHNERSPFATFSIDKPHIGRLPPVMVEVALEVGDGSCRSRFSVELPDAATTVQLAQQVRLPLVASMLRRSTEGLRTNLYIRVSCGDRVLRESSERVTLLPADEWRDDGEDHLWLPSFVLPRDPSVLTVIQAAQRYLRTLLDDVAAGFDGYQQLIEDESNAAEILDPQVQSIWAAIQHDLPLSYINPPPAYSSQSQRLRTPTDILRGQAATCIDLALLFASCMEFVGIYPVIFLIEGHAFPGYWRSDRAWWRLREFRGSVLTPSPAAGLLDTASPPPGGQSQPWMFDTLDNLSELMRYVQLGYLVPLESTYVTQQRGFYEALDEALARLNPDTFDAMVDVQSARDARVTPLPLLIEPTALRGATK